MPTNFPGSLDAFSNPGPTTRRNDPGFELDVVISNLNDAVEAIEAVVGAGAGQQAPSVGLVRVAKADGTAEWLLLALTNFAINGGMERWIGCGAFGLGTLTSIAVPASTTGVAGYAPDQWCLRTGANQACTIDQVTALGTNGQYASRVRRNSGQTGTTTLVYEQPLKTSEIIKLRGQYVSVQALLRGGANWSPASGYVTLRVSCGTGPQGRRGAGFTSETTLIAQPYAVAPGGSNVTVRATSSIVVPSNATQMSLSWEWTPVATAGAADDVTIDDVMLVPGTVPMPFIQRPNDEYECLTFFEPIGTPGAGGIIIRGNTTTGGAAISMMFRFAAVKAKIPTVTKNGTWAVTASNQPTVGTADVTGFYAQAGPTVSGDFFTINNTTDANFSADARL